MERNLGNNFKRHEVMSIYVDDRLIASRFIVSLVVGYSASREIDSPESAAAAALELTRDDGSSSTAWFVFDRATGLMHQLEQDDFDRELRSRSDYASS